MTHLCKTTCNMSNKCLLNLLMEDPFCYLVQRHIHYLCSIIGLVEQMWYAFHMIFQERWEFSPPTSSPYPPAQNRVAARAGFGDEWEKTHLSWKTMWNAFSPMLRCVDKMLPIIIRRCIYWGGEWWQSGEMEISPTCSYHWQHSLTWEKLASLSV